MNTLFSALMILSGYLFGSISSAIVLSRLLKLPDPRKAGSGNPGATNVLRVGGKLAGALTLLGDVLKGLIPVLTARDMQFSENIIALTAMAAFLGHLYPIYFGFKGGKGVATGLGVLLGLSPVIAGIVFGIWLLILALFRYSSLAAITAVTIGWFYAWSELSPEKLSVYTILMIAILWRHRANITRLLGGQETTIGKR